MGGVLASSAYKRSFERALHSQGERIFILFLRSFIPYFAISLFFGLVYFDVPMVFFLNFVALCPAIYGTYVGDKRRKGESLPDDELSDEEDDESE